MRLFVNTHARSGEEALPSVRECLEAAGVPVQEAQATERPPRFREQIRSALAAGVRTFLVGGGDGTISCAARALAGTDAVLGVLPLGTGNDFARSLGIPFELEAACAVIAGGYVRAVDVGLANGRPFLNAATLGISHEITRRLSTSNLKKTAGRLAYPLAAAQSSLEHAAFRIRMTADGGPPQTLDALQVVVGNGRFHGGGAMVAKDATLIDGRLHVYAITGERAEPGAAEAVKTLSSLARVALRMRSGTQEELDSVVAFEATTLTLEAKPRRTVDVDGESMGKTPVTFSVWPGALRVLVPHPS